MIEQGIDGISMTSFADLPAADRWALAFYIRTLAYSADKAVDSKAQWEADALPRTEFDLQKLVRLRAAVRASQLGEPKPPLGDLQLPRILHHPYDDVYDGHRRAIYHTSRLGKPVLRRLLNLKADNASRSESHAL
ncbi:hypothetical protein NP284_08415 [Rhodopseudomonas pseudopalustris]